MADEQSDDDPALAKLRSSLLQRWREYPADLRDDLDRELAAALEQAKAAEVETIMVTSPVSHPERLRLAVIASDRDLDTMYHQEWAELAVSSRGRCYIIYRRRNGAHYASEWGVGATLPSTMVDNLSEALATALLETDED